MLDARKTPTGGLSSCVNSLLPVLTGESQPRPEPLPWFGQGWPAPALMTQWSLRWICEAFFDQSQSRGIATR
jgi:hypothetical protein